MVSVVQPCMLIVNPMELNDLVCSYICSCIFTVGQISIRRVFVILSVPAVGNLSENLCQGVRHLSTLLEAVSVVSFSIFDLKICLFR